MSEGYNFYECNDQMNRDIFIPPFIKFPSNLKTLSSSQSVKKFQLPSINCFFQPVSQKEVENLSDDWLKFMVMKKQFQIVK